MSLFHRHKWTDWVISSRGDVVTIYGGETVGWYIVQERFCTKCGKTAVSQQADNGGYTRSLRKRRPTVIGKKPRKDGVAA